nr:Chain B, Histone-lysine N-methyltransferase SETD1B [Homo sapiens]
GCARSEGFYTI